MTIKQDMACFKEDIIMLKTEMKWMKRIGYYMSGIMTLQLVAIIATKI